MGWIGRNSSAVEAVAASITALVAVAALIGVKFQLDATAAHAREQAARDAYRGHLALAVAYPDFADPQDTCAMLVSPKAGSYAAFVDHMLYSAELTVVTDAGWNSVFMAEMAPHAPYLCSANAPQGDTVEISTLLTEFRDMTCAAITACN